MDSCIKLVAFHFCVASQFIGSSVHISRFFCGCTSYFTFSRRNVDAYFYDSNLTSFALQDCGMQLTDEPDKRCYPLEGTLLCHTCHLRRLGISPDEGVRLPAPTHDEVYPSLHNNRHNSHYPPQQFPSPAPSNSSQQSGYSNPHELYSPRGGPGPFPTHHRAPSPVYSHSGSEASSNYSHLPPYQQKPSPGQQSKNNRNQYQITDL